jgi:tRNA-specific 2-thiouridylase
VDPFLDENLAGRTPSPCVRCNQQVKLARLSSFADAIGATRIATGHYARTARAHDGSPRLLRGIDSNKDQSYFLFGVPRALLERLIFPLGALSKQEAREQARRLGLPSWNKPDSQELCFIPDRDVHGFVARQRANAGRPGPLLDEHGRALGEHRGIEGFTVGQRRGIGLSSAEPRYVLRLIPDANAVVVGPAERLLATELDAANAAWLVERPPASFEASVRIRYRHEPAQAIITPTALGFHVEFDTPQRAVAPGQAAVIYRDADVVGGGFIA